MKHVGTQSTSKDIATQDQLSGSVSPLLLNALINGCFRVNQRQKTGTVTLAAGEYGHDRWKGGASGCTYTFATSGNVVTITITAGSLMQTVEGINLRSGTYCLTWSGTAQGKLAGGSYGASGVTASVTGGTDTNVEFGTGTLHSAQLTPGSVAPPSFAMRDWSTEIMLCQRYCFRFSTDTGPGGALYAFWTVGVNTSSSGGFAHGNFPTAMRSKPTFVMEGALSDYQVYDVSINNYRSLGALNMNAVTNAGFYLLNVGTSSGSGTAGYPFYLSSMNNTYSLRFEAEI